MGSAWRSAGWAGLALMWAASSPAGAHLTELQAGKFPFVDAGGAFIGGGTSWGVVLPRDGEPSSQDSLPFARVCEEAYSFPAVISPSFVHRRDDGAVLLGGFAGNFISRDRGCTYDVIPSLDGKVASAFAVAADGRFLVATATLTEGNGLFASIDDGETWTELLPLVDGAKFFRLVTRGSIIVASGTVTTATTLPALFVSADGGDSFTDASAAYAGFPFVSALALDGDELLLGGFNGQGNGMVLRASPPLYDTFVEQVTGTCSVTLASCLANADCTAPGGEVCQRTGEITHVALVPGGAGAVVALSKLSRTLLLQAAPGEPFVDVSDDLRPSDCLFNTPDGGAIIGCGRDLIGSLAMYMTSTDGLAWEPLVDFDEVSYRICPADTPGQLACAQAFEQDCEDNLDDDLDQLVDCEDDECAERCAPVGEGEGEGEPGEGEGEGDDDDDDFIVIPPPPPACPGCAGVGGGDVAAAGALLVALLVRGSRRVRRAASSR